MYFTIGKRFLSSSLASVTTLVLFVACTAGPTADIGTPTPPIPIETAVHTASAALTVTTAPSNTTAPTTLPAAETIEILPTEVQYLQALADVNIRSGPSTDDETIGSVFAGQLILVTGTTPDNSWWRVICPDDSVGNCFVINDPSLVQPASATGTVAPTSETLTYSDETAGFTFDYPTTWTILGDSQAGARGSIVQLISWPYTPGDSTDETPPGGSRLDVAVLNWDPKNDLAAYTETRKQAWIASGNTIVSEETQMLPGDHPVTRIVLTTAGSSEQNLLLLTAVGDQYLTISGYGDMSVLDTIAQTLQVQP